LRNEKEEILINIDEIEKTKKSIKSKLKKGEHSCPRCKSQVKNDIFFKLEKNNELEELLFFKTDMEASLLSIDKEISREEKVYKDNLELLNNYERKIKINSDEINDVIKYKGYIELRESIIAERSNRIEILNELDKSIYDVKKKIKKYDEKKTKVNKKYSTLMINDRDTLGLKEIDDKKLQKITNTFTAGGSNKSISTVMWYINLLKLKKEFNSSAIKFPLLLDSPNNVEADDENKKQLFSYLFSQTDKESQVIISTLGFDKKSYDNVTINNIIKLENEKYKLLNLKDYNENKYILDVLLE
ncbi:hypothetical protein DMN27_15210, partial [Clostridium perfringens]